MNKRLSFRIASGFLLILVFVAVEYAGGWDVVTLKDFPAYAVAGRPLNLTFKVFVPSLEPLRGLQPTVHASKPGKATKTASLVAKAGALDGNPAGQFTATLVFPEPGEWVVTIDTEYEGASTLPPLTVIAPGARAPAPFAPDVLGLRLFVAKGCNACHAHEALNDGRTYSYGPESYTYGPDLTGKRFAPQYLKKFLADPSITPVPDEVCNRAGNICGSPYAMPNLQLNDAEIEALIAFITQK